MGKIQNEFGHCEYSFESSYVHVYNLFVHPEFRGKGKARELLQRTINTIRDLGHEGEIQIVAAPKDSEIDQNRLSAFYRKMGFEVFEYYGVEG